MQVRNVAAEARESSAHSSNLDSIETACIIKGLEALQTVVRRYLKERLAENGARLLVVRPGLSAGG